MEKRRDVLILADELMAQIKSNQESPDLDQARFLIKMSEDLQQMTDQTLRVFALGMAFERVGGE